MAENSHEIFWRLTSNLRDEVQRSGTTVSHALHDILETATKDELASICEVYPKLRRSLHNEQVYGAFVIIFDGFSEDVFRDFCNGIISLGHKAYTFALDSPDRLSEIEVPEGMTWFPEDFGPILLEKCAEAGLKVTYSLPELVLPFRRHRDVNNQDDENGNHEEELESYEDELKARLPRLWNLYRSE